MTKEEAKKFGLQLLHGIMERNESYPVYANNVKQAIDALSEPNGSLEIPKDLKEAAEDFVWKVMENDDDGISELCRKLRPSSKISDYYDALAEFFIAGAKWQKELMMEGAVKGEVVKDISNKLAVTAKIINLGGFKFGDKVRVIIVKEG